MSFDLVRKRAIGTGLVALVLAASALAEPPPRARVPSPDGRRSAEVRPRPAGGQRVVIDGRTVWPEVRAPAHPEIASPLVWSRRSDALAFLAREPGGLLLLVVAVADGATFQAIVWPLPPSEPLRAVTWLGERRVAAGPAALQPRVVASFTIK